jgi:exopolysaccharide biosynthesis polyprenyl glycosylphosphotransferase
MNSSIDLAGQRSTAHVADSRWLGLVLAIGDAVAVFIAFTVTFVAVGSARHHLADIVLEPLVAVVVGLWAIRLGGLWNPRVTVMRWIELSRLARAAGILCLAMTAFATVATSRSDIATTVIAAVASWALLVAWRSGYRSWVAHERTRDRFVRRVIILGTDRRAVELVRLFAVHPEAGMRVTGLIGSRAEAQAAGVGGLWLGEHDDAEQVLADTSVETVIVCSSDVHPSVIERLMREERRGGRELLLHPGLSGVDANRVKVSPVANEALVYVEAGTLSPAQQWVKRLVDIVVATSLLVIAAPVFAVVAALVKRDDGGPVLFRQPRVGRADREFEMLKFRTMVVDAEARRDELIGDNQRSGPLFKLRADPRVTRIGRILRRTSLDELPQLINVLKGEMSLVGPRPALRSEVDAFPVELHRRHRVRPGITGLWQVEARDNPAFDAYQRLDLFYVENWSPALDMVIMLGTAEQLLLRPFLSRRRGEMVASTMVMPGPAAAG